MTSVDEIRRAYQHYIRQAESDANAQRQIVDGVYRYRLDDEKMGVVLYADLDATHADAVIADQIAYFRNLGYGFEWKYLSYDPLDDLPTRLQRAGLVATETEAVMVLSIANAPLKLLAPITLDIRRITTPTDLKDVEAINRAIWGDEDLGMSQRILSAWENDPDSVSVYVAYIDNQPVSYARNDFVGGKDNIFVGLYGGSTLPNYRNRGIYTALIATRLKEAQARGAYYLLVDARQDTSMPILQKLGFMCIGYATGYQLP